MTIHCHAVWCNKLTYAGAVRLFCGDARLKIAGQIVNADARSGVGHISVDGQMWAKLTDIAKWALATR